MSAKDCKDCVYNKFVCRAGRAQCKFCPLHEVISNTCKCTTIKPFEECPYFMTEDNEVSNA